MTLLIGLFVITLLTKIVDGSRPIIEQRVGFVLDTLQGVLEGYKKIKVSLNIKIVTKIMYELIFYAGLRQGFF